MNNKTGIQLAIIFSSKKAERNFWKHVKAGDYDKIKKMFKRKSIKKIILNGEQS